MPKFEIRLRYRLRAGELAGNVECNEIFSDNDVRNTITVISNLYIKSFESKLIKYQVYYLLNLLQCHVVCCRGSDWDSQAQSRLQLPRIWETSECRWDRAAVEGSDWWRGARALTKPNKRRCLWDLSNIKQVCHMLYSRNTCTHLLEEGWVNAHWFGHNVEAEEMAVDPGSCHGQTVHVLMFICSFLEER